MTAAFESRRVGRQEGDPPTTGGGHGSIPADLRDLIVAYALSIGRLKAREYLLLQKTTGRPRSRTARPIGSGIANATRLLRSGVDIRLVKELLGHEDIKSTVVYTEITDATLSEAVLRLP